MGDDNGTSGTLTGRTVALDIPSARVLAGQAAVIQDLQFEAARVGAALSPAGQRQRVAGVAIFAVSRVLIDATGVRQLGGLASELAKQIAVAAQAQQDAVLADAGKLDAGRLYALPPLPTQPEPAADPA